MFIFLGFVLWFFYGKEEAHMAKSNPFSFVRIETARTTALTFVTIDALNQQKLRAIQHVRDRLGQGS